MNNQPAFAQDGTLGNTQDTFFSPSGKQDHPIETSHNANSQGQHLPQPVPQGIYDAFVKTCQRWEIRPAEQVVFLGHDSESSLAENLIAGHLLRWNRDTRDRAAYIVAISLGLGALFDESAEMERSWLRQARVEFHGNSPLEHILEGSMEHLIHVANLVLEERGLGCVA